MNAATLIGADGDEDVPLAPKTELAARILDRAGAAPRRAGTLSRRQP